MLSTFETSGDAADKLARAAVARAKARNTIVVGRIVLVRWLKGSPRQAFEAALAFNTVVLAYQKSQRCNLVVEQRQRLFSFMWNKLCPLPVIVLNLSFEAAHRMLRWDCRQL